MTTGGTSSVGGTAGIGGTKATGGTTSTGGLASTGGNLSNPILLTPFYSTATGTSIPQFTSITFRNIHGISGGSNTPKVTLNGYDASHMNSVTLDNVVIDGISAANVAASYTNVTLGPGNVNFTPSGTNVNVTNNMSGTSQPNPCTDKWVSF